MTDSAEPAATDHSGGVNKMVDPLLALAERVEAAPEGGVMRDNLRREILRTVAVELAYHWEYPNGTRIENVDILNSLDAIAALQEAVLPGWTFTIRSGDASDGDGRWHECVMKNWRGVDRGDDAPQVKSFGFIPETNARLAALLRAVSMEADNAG